MPPKRAPLPTVTGIVDSYDFQLFPSSHVLKYRALGSQEAWKARKLKKSETVDDVERIIREATAAPAVPRATPVAERSDQGTPAEEPSAPDAKRARTPVVRFSPARWSSYKRNRVGTRHDKVRADSYCDLTAEIEELRGFRSVVVEHLRGHDAQEGGDAALVVSVLQAAVGEYIAAADAADYDDRC